MRRLIACTLFTTLSILPGCDDNAAPDSQGPDSQGPDSQNEAQFSLRGQVAEPVAEAPISDLRVAFVWTNFMSTEGNDFSVAQLTEFDGEFPHAFYVDHFEPPPEGMLMKLDANGPAVGIAMIGAISSKVDTEDYFIEEDLLGVVEQHIVAYVEDDLAPGSKAAAYLGGALEAGYHLLAVSPADPGAYEDCTAANPDDAGACSYLIYDRLQPASEDMAVSLTLGSPDELNVPNVF